MDIEALYDKIYRYCYRRLRDRDRAEDVTQEALTRWLASGPRQEGQALPWLYTAARNLCADEFRRRPTDPLPEELPGPDLPLDRIALRQALESLNEVERELVFLRWVSGEQVSVIAGTMHMSRFAVYRRTAAALEKLRRAMREDDQP